MNKRVIIPLIIFILLAVPAFAQNQVDLYFFEAPGCHFCANLRDWITSIEPNYPTLNVIEINGIAEQDQFREMLSAYDVPLDEWGQVPRVFISNYTCLGDTPCMDDLETVIQDAIEHGCNEPSCEKPEEFHLAKLVALAATDAISPCELAVLTLLLTAIMVRNPERKIKVLFAGLAFALAIFLSYFTFGSLIIMGFKSASTIASFSSVFLYKMLAMFAIGLGILNLKDFIWKDKPICEVPLSWRPRMNKLIAKTTSVPGAFIVGILVSVFLTPCTIGPYFVAGGILSGMIWATALPLLLMYNLIFIAPMIGLVFLIYFGVSTIEKTSEWRKHAWRYTHLLIAIILFGLGIAMLSGWI